MDNIETLEFDIAKYRTRDAVEKLHGEDTRRGGLIREHCGREGAEWFGITSVANLAGAVSTIVARGDHATTERVVRASRAAEDLAVPAPRSLKNTWQSRRVTGQRYDLERVLTGDALPWGRYERSANARGSKIVSLSVPVGGAAGRSAAEIGWVPVAAIVIADILERAGHRVEVWGISTVTNRDTSAQYSMRFPLKDADQPLDINAISRVAHPAVFRGLVLPLRMSTWGVGLIGHAYSSTSEIAPEAHGDPESIKIKNAHSLSGCLAEIKRVVQTFTEQ